MLEVGGRNIDRLIRIINNLLDLSKIEAGKVDLHLKTFDLNELIDSLLVTFKVKEQNPMITLRKQILASNVVIEADHDKLVQVFTNLVGNALKFTQEGTIEIIVHDNGNNIECRVTDSGIDIYPEDIPKVFGKFQQLESNTLIGQKGTGLGLSISKAIVELHHGEIWVESEYGKGTSFIFTLPRKQN
ncbi:MAG: HAMP domain-containing sensor histidine kinase [Candidatus Theseobacter exili]|nr:HAMP domain-containing sensor histidine kinase [Candidatus Theseobacter exili]